MDKIQSGNEAEKSESFYAGKHVCKSRHSNLFCLGKRIQLNLSPLYKRSDDD